MVNYEFLQHKLKMLIFIFLISYFYFYKILKSYIKTNNNLNKLN